MRISRASYRRSGRLIPKRARGLRAGSVALKPGASMPWHTTDDREELIIALTGRIQIETERSQTSRLRTSLRAGQCALLPSRTRHAVVNRSTRTARYLYVTGR